DRAHGMAAHSPTERAVLRDPTPPSAPDGATRTPPSAPSSGLEGIAEFDFGRAARRGYPEAVLCEGKTMDHLVAIARAVGERGTDPHDREALGTIPFTRATAEQAAAVCRVLTGAV